MQILVWPKGGVIRFAGKIIAVFLPVADCYPTCYVYEGFNFSTM